MNHAGLVVTIVLAVFISNSSLGFAQAPPASGLGLWLDASDVNADGTLDALPAGTLVRQWTDKAGGLVFENADEATSPLIDSLAGAPAVLFDGSRYLAETEVADAAFQTDVGEAVVVFDATDSSEGYLFSLDGGQAKYFVALVNWPASRGGTLGLTVQYYAGWGDNNYVGDNTYRADDGDPHLGSVSTDGAMWTFYHNWDGPNTTTSLAGTNVGAWFGDVVQPMAATLGSMTDGDGVPGPDFCCEFKGRLAELLIYDHGLTSAERSAVADYMESKYDFEAPALQRPTGLTATARDDGIFLDWDDHPQVIDGYNIYRSEMPGGPYDQLNVDPVLASEFLDEDVVSGIRYYYVVTALKVTGQSARSEEASAILAAGGAEFKRGDANADGASNITDPINVLNYLFLGGDAPPCLEAADGNNNGALNVTDGIYLLNFLFTGGPEPPAPFSDCGEGPGEPAERLGCASFLPCDA